MDPNKITLYSIKDIISFILSKIALSQVKQAQFILKENISKKILFTLLVDTCYVFNDEYLAITIIDKDGKSLVPCLVNLNDYDGLKYILKNVLLEVPMYDLKIDVRKYDNLYIECIYYDRIIYNFDMKSKKMKKQVPNKEMLDYVTKLLDQDLSNFDDYEEDDEYDV